MQHEVWLEADGRAGKRAVIGAADLKLYRQPKVTPMAIRPGHCHVKPAVEFLDRRMGEPGAATIGHVLPRAEHGRSSAAWPDASAYPPPWGDT